MCIFTNMSPFKLNVLLAKNKIMMAARGGDVASVDIVVPAKNTGIAPGPMLTEFKEAGIPTKIDQGTIWIAKDSTPVLKGEAVNEKLAIILGKLDIKPVEAGIALYCALEDGTKYAESEMVVDINKIRESIIAAHQESVTLSVEAGYVTDRQRTADHRQGRTERNVSGRGGRVHDRADKRTSVAKGTCTRKGSGRQGRELYCQLVSYC